MNQPNQNQLISSALLKWISLLTSNQVTTFEQLSTGEFYLELLSCVKEFKLIKPIKTLSLGEESAFTLATRVSNIKTIGDSVVRYYQTHLMKDISQMKISYVQLCMGNCDEAIKLFSLVVGIFVEENGVILKRFQEALDKLATDDQYIVKALLENTRTIGETIVKNDEATLQKKILKKLQSYEEKIQNLELENKDLRIQFEEESHLRQALQADIKELKTQKSKLIQKAEVLEVLNSRLESENSSLLLENQNFLKKFDSQKRHYDQILAKNQEKLSSLQKEIQLIEPMKLKIDELKGVNSEFKQQLNDRNETSKNEQTKFTLMKENNKILQENLLKVQTKLSEVELEYQELKYKYEESSAIKRMNKLTESPAYRFSNNSQISSLKYRMRDRLESELKGELSQYQMVNSIMVRKSSKEKSRHSGTLNFGNSTLMNGHNLMSSTFEHNLSNFVINEIGNPNIRDIEDVSDFDGETNNHVKIVENEEELDRSMIFDDDQIQKKPSKTSKIKIVDLMEEKTSEEQNFLLIQMISGLYGENEWLKQQLKKYEELRRRKEDRAEEFKKKLATIRQFEPISQINSKYEKAKENVNMMNCQARKQATEYKSNERKGQESEVSSGKRYPFYQMILN